MKQREENVCDQHFALDAGLGYLVEAVDAFQEYQHHFIHIHQLPRPDTMPMRNVYPFARCRAEQGGAEFPPSLGFQLVQNTGFEWTGSFKQPSMDVLCSCLSRQLGCASVSAYVSPPFSQG